MAGFFASARGVGCAQVPHQPDPAQRLQDVVADVDLPPEEALAGATLVVVVVVVPALAERRSAPAASCCGCRRSSRTAALPNRWQSELTMNVAWYSSTVLTTNPHTSRPSPPIRKHSRRQRRCRAPSGSGPATAARGTSCQSRIERPVRRCVPADEHPADVRLPDRLGDRRVRVVVRVGVLVVLAVVGGPPQRPLLRRPSSRARPARTGTTGSSCTSGARSSGGARR